MERDALLFWGPIYTYIHICSGVQMTLGWGDKGLGDVEGGREDVCPKWQGKEGRGVSANCSFSFPRRHRCRFWVIFQILPGKIRTPPQGQCKIWLSLSQQTVAHVDFGKMHHSTSFQSSKLIYDGKLKAEAFRATASSAKARRGWRGAGRLGAGGGGQPHGFVFLNRDLSSDAATGGKAARCIPGCGRNSRVGR